MLLFRLIGIASNEQFETLEHETGFSTHNIAERPSLEFGAAIADISVWRPQAPLGEEITCPTTP